MREHHPRPTLSKPCYDCEEPVPMPRVRVIEAEAIEIGRRPVIRCESCDEDAAAPARKIAGRR